MASAQTHQPLGTGHHRVCRRRVDHWWRAFQAVEGLSAIVKDRYLVLAPLTIYAFDLTA
jgi:hypothetical protein